MKLYKTEKLQQVFEGATVEDFYNRISLQEKYYGKVSVKEDGTYLEAVIPNAYSLGYSWHVSMSLVKATGMLHIPYLYSTYTLKDCV